MPKRKEYTIINHGIITYETLVTARSRKEAWDKYYSGAWDIQDEIEYEEGDAEMVDPPKPLEPKQLKLRLESDNE